MCACVGGGGGGGERTTVLECSKPFTHTSVVSRAREQQKIFDL